MIAVDTNILVYAHRRDSQWHEPAAACIRGLAEQPRSWMIPWPCVHEFLAVVTRAGIFKTPTPLAAALHQVELWMASPSLTVQAETDRHWPLLHNLLTTGKATGGKVHDARIAAICMGAGVSTLYSADRDFSLFPAIKLLNPLLTPR